MIFQNSTAKMNESGYREELHVAVKLALAAGESALKFYGRPLIVEDKGPIDGPVTLADRAANEVIMRGLSEAFPHDGLLSEESADSERRLSIDRVWMIDPLDGTKGFIEGNGEFAVQIGLSEKGTSVLGVVYMPVRETLYWAIRGGGAWVVRRGAKPERMRVREDDKLAEMRMAVSRAHRSDEMDRVMRALGTTREVRSDSVGVKIGLITEHQCDLYIHPAPYTKQWDTCAPEIILTEAGGRLTDLFGGLLRYNAPDVLNHNGIVATNGTVHEAVIERLAPLLEESGRARISLS